MWNNKPRVIKEKVTQKGLGIGAIGHIWKKKPTQKNRRKKKNFCGNAVVTGTCTM
jgi:hypothetical protein